MSNPLVDITTINAVESLFKHGVADPWAPQLAGRLADLIIYSDLVRFALPVPGDGWRGLNHMQEPSLLVQLADEEPGVFSSEEYSTIDPIMLREEYLSICFDKFCAYVKSRPETLKKWIKLHNQPWIRPIQGPRAQHRYVFCLGSLENNPKVKEFANKLGVTEDDLYYSFDVILRFPLYGQLAGESEYYLNHPIREAFQLPTMNWDIDTPPKIAIPFQNSINNLCRKLNQDEYISIIHELRLSIRDIGLQKLRPGECDKRIIRELASKVALQPRLRALGKVLTIIVSMIGGLAASPVLGPTSAIAGAAISVSAAIWDGTLPRGAARLKWLRWSLEWDIEREVDQKRWH